MSAVCEFAHFSGQCVNLTMFDVLKAFEHIDHAHLAREAKRFSFDLCLLRWLLNLYRITRHIVVNKVCTTGVRAYRTIVPGDSFADLLMFLALIGATDKISARYPDAYIGMVCDDLQVLSVGTGDFVTEQAEDIAIDFYESLEHVCRLPVSIKKLVFITKSCRVRRHLIRRVPFLQKAFKKGPEI